MKKYLSIAAALIVMVGVVATTGTAGTSSEEPCEPQDAWTETTGWVLESPGAGWYQVDEKTVVDEKAWTETVSESHWQRYSWTGGPHLEDSPPSFPSDDWQSNVQGDPHRIGAAGAYYVSHGNSGRGDWFYLEWVEGETIDHEAVTHEEFRFAFDHPAVDCPGEELVETSASVEPLQPSCENAGEIGLLLGNEDAVDYSIEGDIAPGSTVSVTASAKAGFELMGDDEWEITFDSFDPSSCEEDPDDPIPGSGVNPTLTSGGSGSGSGSSSSSASSGPQVKAATTSDAPTGSTLPFSL